MSKGNDVDKQRGGGRGEEDVARVSDEVGKERQGEVKGVLGITLLSLDG